MCKCLDILDRELEPQNGRMDRLFLLETSGTRARILVKKRDPKSRKKPPEVMASFCPFCGEPYGKDAS